MRLIRRKELDGRGVRTEWSDCAVEHAQAKLKTGRENVRVMRLEPDGRLFEFLDQIELRVVVCRLEWKITKLI